MVQSKLASALSRARRVSRYVGRWTRYRLGLDSPGVVYVIDSFGWALGEIGIYFHSHALRMGFPGFQLTEEGRAHFGKVVHFASQFFMNQDLHLTTSPSSRLAFTWLHGDPQDTDTAIAGCFRRLPQAIERADRIVTSTDVGADQLREAGCPPDKIEKIPLGVALEVFRPPSADQRRERRASLGIPEDAFVVGSFQKDGLGWGEGMEPKRVKGPDVLCDALGRFHSEHHGLFVLLLGPARGYVKSRLARLGIPYHHRLLDRVAETAPYYDALDAYLIPARTEGGPLALMEAMAKRVPVVSTRMGMPAELLGDGTCGLLSEVEDAGGLAAHLLGLAADPGRAARLAEAAVARVQTYGWDRITEAHVERVWRPMLRDLA